MIQVWDKFNELDLPIDTIWSDIDYMLELTDFTIDTSRYNATDMNVMRKQAIKYTIFIPFQQNKPLKYYF